MIPTLLRSFATLLLQAVILAVAVAGAGLAAGWFAGWAAVGWCLVEMCR